MPVGWQVQTGKIAVLDLHRERGCHYAIHQQASYGSRNSWKE